MLMGVVMVLMVDGEDELSAFETQSIIDKTKAMCSHETIKHQTPLATADNPLPPAIFLLRLLLLLLFIWISEAIPFADDNDGGVFLRNMILLLILFNKLFVFPDDKITFKQLFQLLLLPLLCEY